MVGLLHGLEVKMNCQKIIFDILTRIKMVVMTGNDLQEAKLPVTCESDLDLKRQNVKKMKVCMYFAM